jgi:hypothetical protein
LCIREATMRENGEALQVANDTKLPRGDVEVGG